MKTLNFPHKMIRSKEIRDYYGDKAKFVCFSSGNAVNELKNLNLDVIGCGDYDGADFKPDKWYSPYDIQKEFPGRIDVTCGHLSFDVMESLAVAYKLHIGNLQPGCYCVPTGSGETLVCLKLAYPSREFIAVYNKDSHTKYNPWAPLNSLVEVLANDIIK